METVQSYANPEDVAAVVRKLEPVIADIPQNHLMMAFLALIITLQAPYLDQDQLVEGIKASSAYIAGWVNTNIPPVKLPKELLN